MSDLTDFRDHARHMVFATHTTDCKGWVETDEITRWGVPRRETCPGCLTLTVPQRALWKALADEVDTYLALTATPQEDLFGDVS